MEKKFKILVEKGLDGYYVGEVPEFLGCYSQAKTIKGLMANMKEAIKVYLDSMAELNRKPQKRFFEIKEVVVNV